MDGEWYVGRVRRCGWSMNRQVRDRGTGMRLTETVCYYVLYCIISAGGLDNAGGLLGIAFSSRSLQRFPG